MRLRDLKGLGLKTEKLLQDIGINSPEDLSTLGAVPTFIKLKNESSIKPSLNFLYALVGAIENKHWTDIAKSEKGRLVIELEDIKEFEELFK